MRAIWRSVVLVLLTPLLLSAQQTNVGGITGTVRDSSGAVVAGAKVTIVNQGTHLTQETATDQIGGFAFSLLPIGVYSVTVGLQGFQRVERTNVPVIAGQSFNADFTLAVGQVTQTVTVTSTPPTLDTTTVNMGTTRTVQELSELPVGIAGSGSREAAGFVKTVAGVSQAGYGPDWMQVSRGSINGTPPGYFGYQIDGVNAGAGESETAEDFIAPTPDVVSEVRITDNTDVSVGYNGGVAVAMTLKSGTNALHGSAYYYGVNDALNARNWFAQKVTRARQHEPGFAVGGPVYIPHVYDGRNKTFFFTSIDVFRDQNAGTQLASVPTALMRDGNFTELLGPSVGTDLLGRPVYQNAIYDPETSRILTAGQVDPVTGLVATSSGPIRDPFAFGGVLNVIDPARASHVSQFFQAGYALPTLPGVQNNWLGPQNPPSATYKDQWLLKVDQIISDKHRATFSLEKNVPWFLGSAKGKTAGLSGHSSSQNVSGFLNDLDSTTFVDDRDSYRLHFNYVWTMKPNFLFNFNAGLTRDPNRRQVQLPLTGPNLTGGRDAGLTGTLNPMTPWTVVQGYQNVGGFGPRFGPGQLIDSQRTPFGVNWTWSKSTHTVKLGADYEILPFIYHDLTNVMGSPNFGSSDTALPNFPQTGWGWASFWLGAVNSMSVATPNVNKFTSSAFSLYAQDTWRVTPRLTLNYGLRWDVFPPPHEQFNRIASFDPSIPNPGAGNRLGALTFYGIGAGRNSLTGVYDYYFKALGPKLGFAYQYNPKTVLRASFGISYYPNYVKYISSTGTQTPATGFALTRYATESANPLAPAFYWDNGFPLSFPQLPLLDPTLANGGFHFYLDRRQNRPPMAENIGVEIGRELPGQTVLRVGYVGTMAHRQPIFGYNLNVIPLKDISLGNLLFANVNSPEAQAAGIPVPFPGFNGSVAQALGPYPQYSSLATLSDQFGNSTYHSLQVNLQRHFGALTMLANYTISKWLITGNYAGFVAFGSANFQHPDLRNHEGKQISSLDQPQVLNLSWVYDLPFGTRKHFLKGSNRALNLAVGGWRVSAIQTYSSGRPLSVGGNESIPGVGGVWVNRVPGVPIQLRGCKDINPFGTNNQLLNANAFIDPPPFTLGNAHQLPDVRQCGFANEDIGLEKDFIISERTRVRLGAIFVNAFNRHYWGGIGTNIDNPSSFGTISNASAARQIQYFLRFEF